MQINNNYVKLDFASLQYKDFFMKINFMHVNLLSKLTNFILQTKLIFIQHLVWKAYAISVSIIIQLANPPGFDK